MIPDTYKMIVQVLVSIGVSGIMKEDYIFLSFMQVIDDARQFKGLDKKERISICLGLFDFI